MPLATLGAGPSAIAAAGDWTPADLASLVAWYDASDATTLFTDAGSTQVSSNGQRIYQWNDKSGAGHHMVQTTPAARPIYTTAAINSLSAANFTRNETIAWSGTAFDIACAYCVFTLDGLYPYPGLLETNDSGNARLLFTGGNSTWSFYNPAGAVFDADLRVGGVTTTTIASGGAAQVVSGTRTSAVSRDDLAMSYDYASTTRKWDGYIAEAIITSAKPSTADQNVIGAYLADKWNLSWTDIS